MTLRERRKKAGLSQGDVGRQVGLSISQYSRLEANPGRMRSDQAAAIARLFGCKIEDILPAGTTSGVILASTQRTVQVYRRKDVPVSGELRMLQEIGTLAPTQEVSVEAYGIEIDDLSMVSSEPSSLTIGDWVVVDPSLSPQPGDIVHAIDADETVIRRYHPMHPSNPRAPGYTLRASNRNYDDIVVSGTDGILGVVTEKRVVLRHR